jgi:hypothetical protein
MAALLLFNFRWRLLSRSLGPIDHREMCGNSVEAEEIRAEAKEAEVELPKEELHPFLSVRFAYLCSSCHVSIGGSLCILPHCLWLVSGQ